MSRRTPVLIAVFFIAMVGLLLIAALIGSMRSPGVPKKAILTIDFDRPIVEVSVDDPITEAFQGSVMSLRDLRRALEHAATDSRIQGVRLRLSSYSGGLAMTQEIRQLILALSEAGKPTAVHMDTVGEFSAGNVWYYLASAADEISINSMGDLNLIGLSIRSPFYRGLYDKIGIEPEFPGRGRYKTARFSYTETEFTPEQEEMLIWLIEDLMDQMISDIAAGRGKDDLELRSIIDEAPLIAEEAVDAGMIDHLEDWTAFEERTSSVWGDAEDVSLKRYLERVPKSSGKKIAVLTVEGAILRGDSKPASPFGGPTIGSATVSDAWRDIREANGIEAVIFRVNSPGGSAIASEVIREEMARTAESTPVVVSMATYAASGGYWISCGADKIVAAPATLTGSIGVYAGHMNMSSMWTDKLGVTYGRLDFGKNAAMYGTLDEWTDAERAETEILLDRIYDSFLERVANSRQMNKDAVHEIAEGRVWTGRQALELGLVDRVGGFDVALEEAKTLAGISLDAKVRLVDYPKALPWWQQALGKSADARVEAMFTELASVLETGILPRRGAVQMMPLTIE